MNDKDIFIGSRKKEFMEFFEKHLKVMCADARNHAEELYDQTLVDIILGGTPAEGLNQAACGTLANYFMRCSEVISKDYGYDKENNNHE